MVFFFQRTHTILQINVLLNKRKLLVFLPGDAHFSIVNFGLDFVAFLGSESLARSALILFFN